MKKFVAIILCIVLSMALLVGCGSAASFDTTFDEPASADFMGRNYGAVRQNAVFGEAPELSAMADADWAFEEEMALDDAGMWYSADFVEQESGGGIMPISAPAPVPEGGMADKIIYTVFTDIETMNFDETINGVHALITAYDAFIESSSVSGVNYAAQFHGWNDFRNARFTIRVPNQHLDVVTNRLEDIGNVTHESTDAMNITSQFVDTQSRLNSLLIQEERLLEMLAEAQDVPDLIMIEERISDVRFQIESLTTTINTWQSQIDFSTLHLNIWEVEQFTERQEIHRTYWQQIGDGLASTVRGIGRFFMNLFMWIIVSAPVIIIVLIVLVVVAIIVRAKIRKYIKNKKAKSDGSVTQDAQTSKKAQHKLED